MTQELTPADTQSPAPPGDTFASLDPRTGSVLAAYPIDRKSVV